MWGEIIKEWIYQNFISLDQTVNSFLGGSADETMSSRCFRLNHIKTYSILEKIVNFIFYPFQGPDHCKHAYEKEVLGRQYPYRFYTLALEMNLRYDNEKLGNKIEMPDDNTNNRTENNT
jgi:hypothetical protein